MTRTAPFRKSPVLNGGGKQDKLDANPLKKTLGNIRYEGIFTRSGWAILAILVAEDLVARFMTRQASVEVMLFAAQIALLGGFILVGFLKIRHVDAGGQEADSSPLRLARILEIIIMTVFISLLYHAPLFYFIVLIPVTSLILSLGFRETIPYILAGWLLQSVSQFVVTAVLNDLSTADGLSDLLIQFISVTCQYLLFAFFSYIIGRIHKEYVRSQEENEILIERLGDKYVQLEQAKKEIQSQYDKLSRVNEQLEEANNKLTASIAEFYTLQQISQAISSIFDMNELLKFVNDVIVGVMGVSHSTIALCYGPNNLLKVQVSTIFDKKELAVVSDYINADVLEPAVKDGNSMIDNDVNPDCYPFTRGRNIRSLICVPLISKGNVLGIVLIEHSMPNAFNSDNVRLLEIISQQVGIAIENARLYQQMHDLAIRDGLTGAYNRLYFQDHLETEFRKAQEENYSLSLLIFDIDHFKKFNDTYGHLFGDLVIKNIAAYIMKKLRKEDIFARYGGEEFVILMPHTTLEQVLDKAEELRKGIGSLVITDKEISASVTISVGVSTYPDTADSQVTLLKSADNALYEAKRQGRNRVCVACAAKSGKKA